MIIVLLATGCRKNNTNPEDLSNRLVSQLEYFRGTLNSSSNFKYKNDRLIERDFVRSNGQLKYELAYSDNQVVSYFSRKYDEYWRNTNKTEYTYTSGKLEDVRFLEFSDEAWQEFERWTFTYNGENYDEIVMGDVLNNTFYPTTKLDYTYSGDTLKFYNIYDFVADWVLDKEIKFTYVDGMVNQITVYYTSSSVEYRPNQQFTYTYTNGYNTRVELSVAVDSGWVAVNEIIRSYNISGKMIEEGLKAIGDTEYAYLYNYTYELGKENLDIFPFYDKPLFEYIYPTLVSTKSAEYLNISKSKSEFFRGISAKK